jgi:acyl dehydratase
VSPLRTDVTALPELAGREIGVSAWRLVDATAVAAFADVTGDHQWIHLDARRAADGPFGVPVAHGFLVLALVPAMLEEIVEVAGVHHVLNKEVGNVRFLAPVRVGARIRGHAVLRAARPRPHGHWETTYEVGVECEAVAGQALRASVTYLYRAVGSCPPLPLR